MRVQLGAAIASDSSLERVALALNSTLELREVLAQLARLTLDTTDGHRCSLFLLDGRTLTPAVAIGGGSDDELWAAFQEMGAVDVDSVPGAWDYMHAGHAVGIPEAHTSPLVPPGWAERFDVGTIVLVPLHAAGEPCGVMALDYVGVHEFADDELRYLEAIAAYAGVAIRNARMFESTRRRAILQQRLAEATAALASRLAPEEIVRRCVDAFTELLHVDVCAVGLIDDDHSRISTLAARGAPDLSESIDVSDIPARITEAVSGAWKESAVPLELGEDDWVKQKLGGSKRRLAFMLLPLVFERRARGAVVLGVNGTGRLDPEQMAAANALSAVAAAALQRAALMTRLEEQLRRMEVLHDLAGAIAERSDAEAVIARLNGMLAGHRLEVDSIAFRDRRLARRLGGDELTRAERATLRKRDSSIELADGRVAFPMRLGRRVVGVMRLSPVSIGAAERSFIEALTSGVAEVANRIASRADVEEAEQEQLLAAERGRIAADIHDTAGQIFVAIGLLARREAEKLPTDSPWRERFGRLGELAESGKWEVNRAIEALAFFPAARRGLVAAIRSLARSMHEDSGIEIVVDVAGKPVRLGARVEQSLYRVVHESLTNAWRHSRCSAVHIAFTYSSDEVRVVITDDGIGLLASSKDGPRRGTAGMRRVMEEVGGTLRLRNAKPTGVTVEATVSRERR